MISLDRIHLEVWPRGHELEGQPIDNRVDRAPPKRIVIDLEVADAELLRAFYARSTRAYETAVAAALQYALEHRAHELQLETD